MTIQMDTSEWQMEQLFQDTTGIKFSVFYLPQAAFEFQLFLSKNGVILIYHDIPPHLLKIVDQKPTIAL